ncbi:MAG: hypothetical protein ABR91_04225 [Polaribacter sp. BACL8 MAG-120531-bin13]|jgi:hypothetical protein|nr:MAG: hypothetical protein ABR91_04225 [Polaribacter sp. BACL8 MAG-120531-bin13]KRP14797.1 MAG: hypothetical protein ABR93_00525 [Polaribacter sp. BACL8 MAG-120419-bin8]
MLKKLLLLIALSSNVLFGQEIEFKLSDQELTTLDRGRGLLLQFSGDSLTTIDVAVFEIKSKKALKLPANFTFIEYRLGICTNTIPYLQRKPDQIS